MARGATKTQKKSLPPHLTPGNPGNSGGKKGRSGRKSAAFLENCLKAVEDAELWDNAKTKTPFSVLEMAAHYTHGKPKDTTEHTGKVIVEHTYEHDA